MIYADNAATTQLDKDALTAMLPYLNEEFANPSQPYSFSKFPKKALKEARQIIANCIGADENEIFFTSGGSESNNWVIKGLLPTYHSGNIITSAFEHHSILHSCSFMEKLGFEVEYLQPSIAGFIDPLLLQTTISSHTKLVSIMLINNEIGTIQPIKELCKIAHQSDVYFHTDAVQAIGNINVNVKDLNIDMLSASAHKFNGPKGIGFLYIKNGVKLPSFIDGGSQEFEKRAGTENVASIIGMAVALQKKIKALHDNYTKLQELNKVLLSELELSGLDYRINGEQPKSPGTISLSFKNCNGEMLLHRLDLMKIYVSTGSACNGNNDEVSHVLKAIHVPDEYARGTIRISINPYLTIQNMKQIVEAISSIINKGRTV